MLHDLSRNWEQAQSSAMPLLEHAESRLTLEPLRSKNQLSRLASKDPATPVAA